MGMAEIGPMINAEGAMKEAAHVDGKEELATRLLPYCHKGLEVPVEGVVQVDAIGAQLLPKEHLGYAVHLGAQGYVDPKG